MKTPIANLEDFAALDPFFHIIQEGLAGFVEADHFFDLLAEDIVTEYVVTVPDYPPRVEGRAALAELYRPYGTRMRLERCFDLAVYDDAAKGVVVLEYASEGHAVGTGNRGGRWRDAKVRRLHGRCRASAALDTQGRGPADPR